MRSCKLLIIPCLAVSFALTWGVDQGRAASKDVSLDNNTPNNVTFRDPERVPKLRSTTNAQREDAARKAAEYRAEVARKAALKKNRITGAPPADSTVPAERKGGANE